VTPYIVGDMMKTSKEKERELIIRLHGQERTVREIGKILGISKSKASFWIIRHKKSGTLKDRPRSGKPPMLTKEQFQKVNEALHGYPPSKFGGESMGWDTKMLIQFIKDNFGVAYGVRNAEKIMHKCGIRLIKPRTTHIKASKSVQNAYRSDFKKNSSRNIWIAPSLISTKPRSD